MSFGAQVFFVLVVVVLGSLLYAPVLMIAWRIIVGNVPSYVQAYKTAVLALFSSAFVSLGIMALFGEPLDPGDEESATTVRGLANCLGYVVQSFIFGLFVEDEDGESIGFIRGFLIVLLLPLIAFVVFLPLVLLFLVLGR